MAGVPILLRDYKIGKLTSKTLFSSIAEIVSIFVSLQQQQQQQRLSNGHGVGYCVLYAGRIICVTIAVTD